MIMPHECLECGEKENIGVNITVLVNVHAEPCRLVFACTCLSCNHQWEVTTTDFYIDLDKVTEQ